MSLGKKLFCAILILLIFPPMISQAETVDELTARKYAMQVLSGLPPQNGVRVRSAASAAEPALTKVDYPFTAFMRGGTMKYSVTTLPEPFYVFNSSCGGFIIIAGDDSVEPIIGYSGEGSFVTANMPDNIRWWLGMWAEQIRLNFARNRKASVAVKERWDALESGEGMKTVGGFKKIRTALWGQGTPYNMYCPVVGGGKAVTGCVATATAIVMRYFKYPEKGVGTLPDYKSESKDGNVDIPAHELTTVYDWGNMPLEYKGTETSTQKEAVARLMYDLGVMLQMSYGYSGSGAYSSFIAPGLKRYMGYDKSSNIYNYRDYTLDAWLALLKKNIDEVGPLCYGGSGDRGGHEFVVDGYDVAGNFSINWGWEGIDNGYFAINEFQDFTENQDVTVFKPESGGKDSRYLTIYPYSGSVGLECDTDTFMPGEPFKVRCYLLANLLNEPFNGYIGFGRISREGKVMEVKVVEDYEGEEDEQEIDPWNGIGVSDEISFSSIAIGDYMTMVTRAVDSDEWIPAAYDHYDSNLVGAIPLADATSIEEESSIKYTVSSGILLVSTKKDVIWTFRTALGEDASSAAEWSVVEGRGILTIATSGLDAGGYVLELVKGIDSKTIEFKVGTEK